MPKRIFLSYRRDDSAGQSGRIRDRLVREFGNNYLFMDVDGIPLGVDFIKRLNDEVAQCDVLLAVIGRHWLELKDENGRRRVDNPNDYVRVEVSAALRRDIPVIPILLDNTRIPTAETLPDDIKQISTRNGLDVRHGTFHADVDRLVAELKTIFRQPVGPTDFPLALACSIAFLVTGVLTALSYWAVLYLSAPVLTFLYPSGNHDGGTLGLTSNLFRAIALVGYYYGLLSAASLIAIFLFRNSSRAFWLKQSVTVATFAVSLTMFLSNWSAQLNLPSLGGLLFCCAISIISLAGVALMNKRKQLR